MKKLVFTSIVLIVIPTLLFIPLCILISYSATHNNVDYSQDVLGTWEAFQYYADSEMFVCDDENALTIVFDVDSLSVLGTETILNRADNTDYIWTSSVSISYTLGESKTRIFISFNTRGNMQIKTEDGRYTILLRRTET